MAETVDIYFTVESLTVSVLARRIYHVLDAIENFSARLKKSIQLNLWCERFQFEIHLEIGSGSQLANREKISALLH